MTAPCPAQPADSGAAHFGAPVNPSECHPALGVVRGDHYQLQEARRIGALWATVGDCPIQADGWASGRFWLEWPAGTPLDWRILADGPGGLTAPWHVWRADIAGARTVCVGSLWRARLQVRVPNGGPGAVPDVRCSWTRYPWTEPVDRPAPSLQVCTVWTVPVGSDLVIPALEAQEYISVQLRSLAPLAVLLALQPSTAGGTLGNILNGSTAVNQAGGFEEDRHSGPVALWALGGAPATVGVVQR